MLLQEGRKMPILNSQNTTSSLQQLAERNAIGNIQAITDNQKYLKQIKKNAKAIDESISVRIKTAKASIIGAAFNRPLIPPNAHDKIKIKLPKNNIYNYINRLRQYVETANQEYGTFGLPTINFPSNDDIQSLINKSDGNDVEMEVDYLSMCQVMRFMLQDSYLAKSPQEQEFFLQTTSAVVSGLQSDNAKKDSITKKIGYVRMGFSIASAVVSGVVFLGSYLGLFATPTLAILGMSFPIATIVCIALCTLPFIITMIKNIIGQIADKTSDLDLELLQGTSKDLPVKGIHQALELVSQAKQQAKRKEDVIATNGMVTSMKHSIKEKQLAFGNIFLEICKEQNVKPEEMLAKCKDINFVQQNNDNPAVAIMMNSIMQGVDMYEAIVCAKLKQNKQTNLTKDLVDNVVYHSKKLNINPIDATKYMDNIDINTANYSELVLSSIFRQAKNHNIDLGKEVQRRLNGKNSGNMLSNGISEYGGSKLVNDDYYNNTMVGNNNNIANTGIPKDILTGNFLQ